MKSNERVGKVRSLINGYKSTYVMTAAARVGVFQALAKGAMTSSELAEKLGFAAVRLEPVLNAIACFGFIDKEGEVYSLGAYKEVFDPESPQCQLGYINHAFNMSEKWRGLENAIRAEDTSLSNFNGLTGGSKQATKAFLEAMNTNAVPQSIYLTNNFDFSGHTYIDIGAGYGTYSIALAKKYESASGIAFDLPMAAEIIQENINAEGLSDRVSVVAGNYKDNLPNGPFDDAFLFAIIHQENAEDAQSLLNSVSDIVKDHGRLFLTSFFLEPNRISPEFSVLFGVEMLVGSGHGRVYSHDEIKIMLQKAGFNRVECDPKIPGPATLYIATK